MLDDFLFICFTNFVLLYEDSGRIGGDGDCLHLKADCHIVVSCLEFVCMLKFYTNFVIWRCCCEDVILLAFLDLLFSCGGGRWHKQLIAAQRRAGIHFVVTILLLSN